MEKHGENSLHAACMHELHVQMQEDFVLYRWSCAHRHHQRSCDALNQFSTCSSFRHVLYRTCAFQMLDVCSSGIQQLCACSP